MQKPLACSAQSPLLFDGSRKLYDPATFWRYRKPVKLDYDPAKRAWTLEHRQLDFVDARLVWAGPHFDFADAREDYGEARVCTVRLCARANGDGRLGWPGRRSPGYFDEEVQ